MLDFVPLNKIEFDYNSLYYNIGESDYITLDNVKM